MFKNDADGIEHKPEVNCMYNLTEMAFEAIVAVFTVYFTGMAFEATGVLIAVLVQGQLVQGTRCDADGDDGTNDIPSVDDMLDQVHRSRQKWITY